MIPLAIPNLSGNEGRYLQECVETNFVSSVGPFVDRLEAIVADETGGARAIATSAGTTGLHVALIAVGVGPDDLVLLPDYTFIASANAIAHCGAEPWLLDIDRVSWNLDPNRVGEALSQQTRRVGGDLIHRETGRRVAAIMPVYALGLPADMDPLVALAREYGLPVVADAAAAIGATYKGGRRIGELGADLTVLSFNGNKIVTAGGGGAVVASDPELADRVRHLTTTARSGNDYDHDQVGFNYRMTNLQAAVGCGQLELLAQFVESKRRIASRYDEGLGELRGVSLFPAPDWAESSCWMSGICIASPPVSEIIPRLQAEGIGARTFWKPMSLQTPFRNCPKEPTPVSNEVWKGVLTLPCSTSLSDSEQEKVIRAVRNSLAEVPRQNAAGMQ